MRARILAFIILLFLLIIPAGLYLYFMNQKVASFEVIGDSGQIFSVDLVGKYGIDGLPLVDHILHYQQMCTRSCILTPVLPANYILTVKASGKIDIHDAFPLHIGERIRREYHFEDRFQFIPAGVYPTQDDIITTTLKNTKVLLSGTPQPIGMDAMGRVWISLSNYQSTQVGILSETQWTPIKNIAFVPSRAYFDLSKNVVILHFSKGDTLLLSSRLSFEKEITLPENTEVRAITQDADGKWKIRTDKGLYDIGRNTPQEDIRFTDSIDLSPTLRLGYIDGKDTKRLSLSNYPLGTSVLLRLDRSTGKSIVIEYGKDIEAFFLYGGKPAYKDSQDHIFLIQ